MDISPDLVEAISWVESSGDPFAVSPMDCRGLCQLSRAAWGEVMLVPFLKFFWSDPELNKLACKRYLELLKKRLGKHYTLPLLIASYNCGAERVRKSGYNLNKCPIKTREYVAKVLNKLKEIKNGKSN